MPKRPLSVTLVAVFLLAYAALSFLTLAAARQDPSMLANVTMPPGMTVEDVSRLIPAMMFTFVVVALVGIGLLRGLNWARIAVVALAIFVVLAAVLQGSMTALLPAAFLALMAFVLYRPLANVFFAYKRRGASVPTDGPDGGVPPGSGNGSGTFVA